MEKRTKNILLIGGVLVAGYLIYNANKKKTETASGFSNASGQMQCQCRGEGGGYSLRQCRKTQHSDCSTCCGHYGGVSDNVNVRNKNASSTPQLQIRKIAPKSWA